MFLKILCLYITIYNSVQEAPKDMAIYDPLDHVQTEKSVDLHGHRIKLLSRKHVHSQGRYKG